MAKTPKLLVKADNNPLALRVVWMLRNLPSGKEVGAVMDNTFLTQRYKSLALGADQWPFMHEI